MAADALHREVIRRIDQARKRRRWTRAQLADFSGVSRGSLSMLMAGKNSPSLRNLGKIATALNMKIRDLMPD